MTENKCVCGWTGKNGRALHAHKLTCRQADEQPPAAAACCDEPDYKLIGKLRDVVGPAAVIHLRQLGYKEFCDNCGELR